MSYAAKHRPGYPWGYWLRGVERPYGLGYVDDDGGVWRSVREAFWYGRLRMPVVTNAFDRGFEKLFGVLTTIDRRSPRIDEMVVEMFEGDRAFYHFYLYWLISAGLLDPDHWDPSYPRLSDEGRAVLMMMAATRPQPFWAVAVGADTVAALELDHPVAADRERWFERTAAFAAGMQFRFRRDFVNGKWAIVLTGDDLGDAMPIVRTIWSHFFNDAEVRDRFHHWLCIRLDRWAAWGDIAHRQGADELTDRLLTLMAIELTGGDDVVQPPLSIVDDRGSVGP